MASARKLWALVLAAFALPSYAGTAIWGGTNGNWNDPLGWDIHAVPNLSIDAYIDSGTVALSSPGSANYVYVANSPFTLGTLQLDATLNAKWLIAGNQGVKGTVIQNGDAFLSVGVAVAASANGSGQYTLNSGTLEAQLFQIGNQGTGVFDQYGGTVRTVTNDPDPSLGTSLTVGIGSPTGNGNYNLHAGRVEAQLLQIGASTASQASGTFNQSDGDVVAGSLNIGVNGVYHLDGGTLSTGNGSNGMVGFGVDISGKLVQTGGTLNHSNEFFIVEGRYELNDGALNVVGDVSLGGTDAKPAHFVQTGGSVLLTAPFGQPGFEGGLAIQSHAVYELSGTGDLQADILSIGHSDKGAVFHQEGGSATVGTLNVGELGTGEFQLVDGSLSVAGGTQVGQIGNGAGTFTQSGGISSLGPVGINTAASQLSLNGGSLTATSVFVSSGIFAVSDGDASINGSIQVQDGGSMFVNGGTVTADELRLLDTSDAASTLTMTGGTLTVAGAVFVGSPGSAQIDVSGGFLETGNVLVAPIAGEVGNVNVSGASTVWNIHGAGFFAEDFGTGKFDVHDGATVNLSGAIYSPEVTVSSGATINMDFGALFAQHVTIGGGGTISGTGTMQNILGAATTVSNGGKLEVKGEYFAQDGKQTHLYLNGVYSQTAAGTMHVIMDDRDLITATAPAYVPLLISGNATIAGNLEIDASQIAPPVRGDQFRVMTAAKIQGAFNNGDPLLRDGNLRFKIEQPASVNGQPDSINLLAHPALVELAWDQASPYEVAIVPDAATGTTHVVTRMTSTPVPPLPALQTPQSLRDQTLAQVQDYYTQAGVQNIIFKNLLPGQIPSADASVVYFSARSDVPGLKTLGGISFLPIDRFDLSDAGAVGVFAIPTDTASSLALTVAHEVGHSLGLRHVQSPDQNDVMDYFTTSAKFNNIIMPIIDPPRGNDQVNLGLTENPQYNLLHYIDGISKTDLESRNIHPGTWDREDLMVPVEPIEITLTSLLSPKAQILYNVNIFGGTDLADGEPNISGLPLLKHYEQISLSDLLKESWPLDRYSLFNLIASSTPGGIDDIILSTGDPYVLDNDTLFLDGTPIPAYLQLADGAGGYETLASVTLYVPEPGAGGLMLAMTIFWNLKRKGKSNFSTAHLPSPPKIKK